ncbi:hypothetical protein SD70_06835 [Gordoniibacillus kamchatkensis]|uniref:Uncharacterized protein n=1 Tax=Gordoniibacillus kamchatkensis TaxID=1590651 RepID=A0ABR5AKK4_9BACL|nr:hypothetical protein [Paenibacillus sp. VKM B-2647]KIL41566.1 hypothetical protein SD70_06835 [Paenibacillus sp. VKM B-2647]
MNLADMLSYADIGQLSRIARTYDCECNGHSKHELIQSILSKVGRRDVFEEQVESLSVEDIRFLNSLLFDARSSFSLEELVARVQQTKFVRGEEEDGWNPRDMITRFKQLGWLFNGYSQQTKYLFQVPSDLKKRFSDVLAKKFQTGLDAIDGEPGVYRDEQKLIVEDIVHFLRFVRERDVPLTDAGSMYKRTLGQVLDSMSVREEPLGKTAFRFGYGRMFKEYPNRFSLIYDYCYYNGLIAEDGGLLTLTETGSGQAESGMPGELPAVYRFWLRLYKNPIPNIQSIVQWVERLARAWVTADSLGNTLCPLIRPFYFDSSESIFEQRIVQMMMHLGLLRIGEDDRRGRVVQMTKLGSSIIQGTYVDEEDRIPLSVEP